MVRIAYLLFGVFAYFVFFATFLYLIAFLANISLLSTSVDRGVVIDAVSALVIDLALVGVFGLQHSVMARRGFKAAWTRIVPPAIERSTYVIFASLALILLFSFWRPMPNVVWSVENDFGVAVLWSLFALGWLIVLLSTFLISHFELFGLKQVYLNLRRRAPASPQFRQPFFYKLVRHPLYSGFFLAFWATPVMSVGHLVLALGMSAYMLIAIGYEERDMIHMFGSDYRRYRQDVGMLIPRLGSRPR